MRTSLHTLALSALLAATSLAGAGCSGEANQDVFYVYVVNGYAGGGDITVYSSTGPLTEDLAFGDATAEPVEVDRTRFGGEIQIGMEGMNSLATVALDSFAFYPDETITLFVKRRSGENTFELQVMRHNLLTLGNAGQGQAPSNRPCVVQFYNGLSLSNVYTDSRYTMQTQWDYSANNSYTRFYNTAQEALIPTECGELNLSTFSQGTAIQAQRAMLVQQIVNDPWLYLVEDPDGNALTWRWGYWDTVTGNGIAGIRGTQEYRECISQAISFTTPMTGGPTCDPDGVPDSDNVEVDLKSVQACLEPTIYTGRSIDPGTTDQSLTVFYPPFQPNDCSFKARLRTRTVDSVFDATVPAAPVNTPNMGPYPVIQVTFTPPDWQHVMVYGRPINPLVYQVTSSKQVQPYGEINEYPNGKTGMGTRTQNEGGQNFGQAQ